jgi:hypothetical protein
MYKQIAMACDHAGFETKEILKAWLLEKGFEVKDFGTHSTDSCDYPDFAHPMADSVEKGKSDIGISLCAILSQLIAMCTFRPLAFSLLLPGMLIKSSIKIRNTQMQ